MRQSARGVVIEDGQLLVIWRNNHGQTYISLPGGGIEDGEDEESAVAREVLEETGLTVKVGEKIYEANREDWGHDVFYAAAYVSGGEPALQPGVIEERLNAEGKDTFRPGWLRLDELNCQDFWPDTLKALLAAGVDPGIIDLRKAKKE